MNEWDQQGWAPIHNASYKGFIKSVERFVKANEEQVDWETRDGVSSTPLLLAVMGGDLDTIKCLIEHGAKIAAINSENHGVVELCAMKQYISLLEYFIGLGDEQLPVWKNLVKLFSSETDEESENGGKCLRVLTQRSAERLNPNWKVCFDNEVIPAIVKVVKSGNSNEAKVQAFHVLLNLIEEDVVKDQFGSSGGPDALVKLIKGGAHNYVIQLSAQSLKELCAVRKYTDKAAACGAIAALVKVFGSISDPEVLVECLDALGNIAGGSSTHQQSIGTTQGSVSAIVNVFENTNDQALLLALTRAIAKITENQTENQTAFVKENVVPQIIVLIRSKHRELQLNAVEAIHKLAEQNVFTQKAIQDACAQEPLIHLLRKSRQQVIQERTAAALWAIAGEDIEERQKLAENIGVQQLVEFLSSLSEDLHYIGSEGLCVLAQGPLNKQTPIANANGVQPLVRLLRSDKEHIVLSVIRTLRALCVGIAYVPHPANQHTITLNRGIRFLIALMVHSRNDLIQVEAAHTLACVTMGNVANLEDMHQNPDFSYVRVLKMLYNPDKMVRLLAGSALAAFAYNNVHQQRAMAEQGGVRFACFEPFLRDEDEFCQCNAAFQVVVLARIIPDEEQAISSAAGIKKLVEVLEISKSENIQSLASDCVARLVHTRAGIPAAFVSIETVTLLCNLLNAEAEQVRGCAAISLGYLSYDNLARRQMLNICRHDPYLMKVLQYYTKHAKLSPEFAEGFKHYRQIGLPPLDEGRVCLVGKKNVHYKDAGRPHTIASFDDTGGSSNIHSSPTNMHQHLLSSEEQLAMGRMSQASRTTQQSASRSNFTHRSDHHQSHQSLLSNDMQDNMPPSEVAA